MVRNEVVGANGCSPLLSSRPFCIEGWGEPLPSRDFGIVFDLEAPKT
ncbi:hypothetical protein [Scytonema sp. NUACC21]